ncbi:uncharacterized protein J3R85_013136 [Psidium guajava]|nr:uncharacterized protein J3R85_013136 [Psidium guajava]
MASFAIILVVWGALCSIGGMHFPPARALVAHGEGGPFPPLLPARRCGPPEFVNRDHRPHMEPRLQDWEPGTPPRRPPRGNPVKLGHGPAEVPAVAHSNPILDLDPGTAEEPMVPDSNPIPVPGTTVAEELPNSEGAPPQKPGFLQDLHLIPVPVTGGGPYAYP